MGEFMKTTYVKPDDRNRIVLTKAVPAKQIAQAYKIYVEGNKIILEPVEIPEAEQWLYKPKNRKLLDELKRRLKEEKATIDLGSFAKYLDE